MSDLEKTTNMPVWSFLEVARLMYRFLGNYKMGAKKMLI